MAKSFQMNYFSVMVTNKAHNGQMMELMELHTVTFLTLMTEILRLIITNKWMMKQISGLASLEYAKGTNID